MSVSCKKVGDLENSLLDLINIYVVHMFNKIQEQILINNVNRILCVVLMVKDIHCFKCDIGSSRINHVVVRALSSPYNSPKKKTNNVNHILNPITT